MADYNTIEFKKIFIGNITLGNGMVISYGSNHIASRVLNQGKMACFKVGQKSHTAREYILRYTAFNRPKMGDRLYISKDCKTPRDLFRNSGYKITLDPDKSDYVIIPDIKPGAHRFYCDIIGYNEKFKAIYLYSISKRGYTKIDDQDLDCDDHKAVEDFISVRNQLKIITDGIQLNTKVDIVPRCEEYIDILQEKYPNRKYRLESGVPFNLPIDINLETLTLWKHSKDYELIAKSICNSNWREYPFTLCMFISLFCDMLYYYGNSAFRNILDQIGYTKGYLLESMFEGRSIEAKDWNLSQDMLLSFRGVDLKGGYVEEDSTYDEYLRHKMAVAPLKLDSPMKFENIQTLLRQ